MGTDDLDLLARTVAAEELLDGALEVIAGLVHSAFVSGHPMMTSSLPWARAFRLLALHDLMEITGDDSVSSVVARWKTK